LFFSNQKLLILKLLYKLMQLYIKKQKLIQINLLKIQFQVSFGLPSRVERGCAYTEMHHMLSF